MQSIYLIRHAEKPEVALGQRGVSSSGEPDAQGLSVRGWQRAGALVHLFAIGESAVRHSLLARPQRLYAAVDEGRSHRPEDTLQPLAQCLGLPVLPLPSNSDPRIVADELLSDDGDALVCWRRRELPPLARALLPGTDGLPDVWDKSWFDLVWVIRPSSLTVVPQRLLPGDRGYAMCLKR